MSKAIVLFSGGQDSTTCLCQAIEKYGKENIEAVSFDYGQRHKIELQCAKNICQILDIKHKVYSLSIFEELGNNSLIENIDIVEEPGKLPNSFVPGRNLVFVTYAAIHAYQRGANILITGMCQTDYSGYPDCRQETISALNTALELGMEYNITILAPLMYLTKKQSVELINELGYLNILKYTHTCYKGENPPCGKCPSCILRAKGFAEAGITDPLLNG